MTGHFITNYLHELDIDFVNLDGKMTRMCTTVLCKKTGTMTELIVYIVDKGTGGNGYTRFTKPVAPGCVKNI
jgi:hypothetical protein